MVRLLPFTLDANKGETVMPDPVIPDTPADQSITTDVDNAVSAVKAVEANPSLSTATSGVAAVEAVLDNPTAKALETDIPPLIKESKAGYKTTEFWGAIAAAVTDISTTLPATDKVALLALSGVYAIARGIAKNGIPDIVSPGAPQ